MDMGITELSTTINIIINIANINMSISGLKGINLDRAFYVLSAAFNWLFAILVYVTSSGLRRVA